MVSWQRRGRGEIEKIIMLTYVIREANSKKMVSCWEGLDGKDRAVELTESHNKYLPVKWFVSEEII